MDRATCPDCGARLPHRIRIFEESSAIKPAWHGPIRLHDLRHGWATLALKAGVPLKVVSERLGHTTTTITADIYSHVTSGMQTDAAEKVASLIFGSTKPL